MKLIKIDKNGSKHYEGMITCDRCGGDGVYKWGAVINGRPQYAGVCFKCDGAGKVLGRWIERTPEYQAKLDAKRKARQEARQAEWDRVRKELEEKEEAERLEREARIKAEKAISQFQGEIGQKITVDIAKSRTATFETQFGTMRVHIMKDADGNVYVWKTQNGLGYYYEDEKNGYMEAKGKRWSWHVIEEDEPFVITGTIKDHNEYMDEKQTVLTRCKVAEKEDK